MLQLDIEKGYDFRVFETLEKLNEIVKEKILCAEDASRLIAELDKLDNKFGIIKDSIKGNIKIN